jgi:SAM-dependent methyltransferase
VLHNEGIARGRTLIRQLHRELRPGGRLLIADIIANDDHTGPLIPMLFGLNMLVLTEHGGIFSEAKVREALQDAGFTSLQKLPSPAYSLFMLAGK